MAIHPAGHFFAVGHADGTISFWAIEDEDHPLFVRTIDDLDEVNVVDGNKIEQYLPSGNVPDKEKAPPTDREPIFKLAWSGFANSSDPRGGETALTVLGGMMVGDASGVSVLWLPAFNPPEPPVTAGAQRGLHPFLRKAMRESLFPLKSFFYTTSGPTQDFLLFPKDSPYFAGAFDPNSIILLSDFAGDTCAVEALQFPPPAFLAPSATDNEPPTPVDAIETSHTSDALSEDLASTLQAMTMTDDPKSLKLPPTVRSGSSGVIHGETIRVERDAYEAFTAEDNVVDYVLPLKGGIAHVDDMKANEAKLSKVSTCTAGASKALIQIIYFMQYQPHRILITHHRDLTVQFQDISAQLLLNPGSSSIHRDFPETLHAFTIEVASLLTDGSVTMHMSPSFVSKASIASVHLAQESLECAVVFKTGELVLYRLSSGEHSDAVYREADDKELIIVEHVPKSANRKYHPYFMLAPGLGIISAYALSDIGKQIRINPDSLNPYPSQASLLLHMLMAHCLLLICEVLR